MAGQSPDRAARLFIKLENNEPFVRVRTNPAGVTLDAEAVWSAVSDPILQEICFKRLNRAANDHDLALEVLAALNTGCHRVLTDYMDSQLATEEPAMICRAVMVAGLADRNAYSDALLARYEGARGFIGNAHNAAKYAYDRNRWAQHWFKTMRQTESPQEFWCHSILFTKVVDGRFEVWKTRNSTSNKPFQLFWPSVKSNLKQRYKNWKTKREKKLFGDDAPSKELLLQGKDHEPSR